MKLIFTIGIFFLLCECVRKEDIQRELKGNLTLSVINNDNTAGLSRNSIEIILTVSNPTNESIYMFRPAIWVIDENNREQRPLSFYTGEIIQPYPDTSLNNTNSYNHLGRLLYENTVAKNKKLSFYSYRINLEEALFINAKSKVQLRFLCNRFFHLREEKKYTIFIKNLNQEYINNIDKIYTSLPANFRGYKYVKKSFVTDSLHLITLYK